MPAYASLEDLTRRYGLQRLIDLTDRADPPAGEIDAAAVAAALDAASSLIDGYLRPVIALPLAAVPAQLRQAAEAIALYRLSGDELDRDGKTAADHREALAWLRDVADGRAVLGVGAAEAPAAPARTVKMAGPARVFDRGAMKVF